MAVSVVDQREVGRDAGALDCAYALNAWCNWVDSFRSVQLSSCAVNKPQLAQRPALATDKTASVRRHVVSVSRRLTEQKTATVTKF